jgi:hypothetical protein
MTASKILSLLLSLTIQAPAEQPCNTFRDCESSGGAARDAGDLATAKAYYSRACFMEVADPLLGLRDNACRQVTTISKELDDYASAYTFFNEPCADGKDAGCFHLALLENDRGNLETAMEIMKPLCDKKYIIHKNISTTGCREYRRMTREWDIQNPREPRANSIQLPVLVIFLLLSLTAIGFLVFRRYPIGLILSILAFATYAYYESGVSPYAAIRIDLLIILPLLVVDLVVFAGSVWGLLRKKTLS